MTNRICLFQISSNSVRCMLHCLNFIRSKLLWPEPFCARCARQHRWRSSRRARCKHLVRCRFNQSDARNSKGLWLEQLELRGSCYAFPATSGGARKKLWLWVRTNDVLPGHVIDLKRYFSFKIYLLLVSPCIWMGPMFKNLIFVSLFIVSTTIKFVISFVEVIPDSRS